MDDKDMINKENDRDEARPLDAEELSKVNGGLNTGTPLSFGLSFIRRCSKCKAETPHIMTSDGRYCCYYCNTLNW